MPKPFYALWTASSLMSLSNVIYIMIITTYMYGQTGSAAFAALFPLFQTTARFLAGFSTPLLVESWSLKKLAISLSLGKGLLLILLACLFPYLSHHIWILLVCIACIAMLEGWLLPVSKTLIPLLAGSEKLAKANSMMSFSNQAFQAAGYTFTGFLVVKAGITSTFLLGTGLALLSWMAFLAAVRPLPTHTVEKENKSQSKWSLMKEGWVVLWKQKSLRLITWMDMIEGLAGSIWIGAITLVYVQEILGKQENWWGYINTSYYIGTLLGALISFYLAAAIQRHLVRSMAIGSLFFGLFTFLYGSISMPGLALLLCVLMGPAYQIRDTAQQTAFQQYVPTGLLPKVYAAQGILLSSIVSLSVLVVGLVADIWGVRTVYWLGGLCSLISAVLSLGLNHIRKGPNK